MSVFAITIAIICIAAILAVRSSRLTPEAAAAAGRQPSRTILDSSQLEVAPTSEEILEQLCSRPDE